MYVGTQDVSPSLTATGTTQATALLLINGINVLGTVASGTGVALYPANPGTSQTVYNGGANPVTVYPPLGSKINQIAVNGGHLLATNTSCVYFNATATQVIANLSA